MKKRLAFAVTLASILSTVAVFPAYAATTPTVTGMSQQNANVSYTRSVTFTGTGLTGLSALYLGSTKLANLSVASDVSATATVDTAPNFQPGTYTLYDVASGSTTKVNTGLSLTYNVSTNQDKEMQYLGLNLDKKGTSTYPYYTNEDCANFASQVIHARGLSTTTSWSSGTTNWTSSTHLRSYLLGRGSVTEYSDSQANRAKVRIGDIVQFDWDRSGDRDHTGIVTRVTTSASGVITVYYSAHTDPNDDPSHNLSIEATEATHQKVLGLSSLGKAYFLVLN